MTPTTSSAARPLALILFPLLVTIAAPAQTARPSAQLPSFNAPVPYLTGSSGAGSLIAATADFNGDGIPDLATANFASGSISVLLGAGGGLFQPPVNYAVGNQPYGIVAGDFNNDGRPDLAIANAGDFTVTILLNTGSGVFPATPSATLSVPGAFGLSLGDLNRDGFADLIVTQPAGGSLSVLLGNGDGSFRAAAAYAAGSSPYGTAIGDLNGDGYPDLVVWNVASNNVGVLLNNRSGGFLPQVTYATGAYPYSVAVGDFNSDGSPDLAVANLGGNSITVLLNNKAGVFTTAGSLATGSEPTSVLAADLNADGVLDLAVTNLADGTLGVLLGKGDGTFLAQAASPAGAQPYTAIAIDLDGDGRADLAITNFAANSIATLLEPRPASFDIATYHVDNARTGLNPFETILTPANVSSARFGKLVNLPTGGKVDAEPLYLAQVPIAGQSRNVVYVASEDDSVYAFDADTGASLWTHSALGTGETTSDPHSCNQITPQIGITSTPVIDRARGPNGVIFVVAMSKDTAGAYHQRLHALDLTTGQEITGSPTEITGSYPGTGDNSSNGSVVFDPHQYAERVGLLLMDQTLYLGWTSHCDQRPYTGWMMGYSEATLQQTQILNLTPNGNEGAIWMSGAGLAGDTTGNVYLLDANGLLDASFDANGFPSSQDYGNAILKLSTRTPSLAVADFFEPYNTQAESAADVDLGSGGTLLLPDQTDAAGAVHHLLVGAGKDRNIYIADRDRLGRFNAADNSNLYQELAGALPNGAWSMPAYYNHTVYYGGVSDYLRAFPVRNARLAAAPSSTSATKFGYPGATPSISANGNTSGIVWALESGTGSAGVLHAYDAANLAHELYNSNQAAGSRDAFGLGNKFITPVIAHGKVYVPTPAGVTVFGLLN